MPGGRPRASLAERFWGKIDKSENCWLWCGSIAGNGYGFLHDRGGKPENPRAHRVSWQIHFGRIPDGLIVCHHCDVRNCVRPDHLFLGTNEANSRDMVRKGRSTKGEKHWTRFHPERVFRGHRKKPERWPRGDDHWARRYPELVKRGTAHARAKLTDEKVRDIRHALSGGTSLNSLAARYGVDKKAILQIKQGKTWAHVA